MFKRSPGGNRRSREPLSLRSRTLLAVGISLVGFMTILLVTLRLVTLHQYRDFEAKETTAGVDRLVKLIQEDTLNLDGITDNYSRLDAAYQYALGGNQGFPQAAFDPTSTASLRLNLVLIFDSTGKLLFGSISENGQTWQPVPRGALGLITSNQKLVQHPSLASSVTGNLILPQGPMMVSSRPIRTSLGQGPIAGTLVFGRKLDKAEMKRIEGDGLEAVSFAAWTGNDLPADFQKARNFLAGQASTQGSAPVYLQAVDNATISGYTVLTNVNGDKALLVRIDLPRTIYQEGQANILGLSLYLFITGLAFSGILTLVVSLALIEPVARLSNEAQSLSQREDLNARLRVGGSAELTRLAGAFNRLLKAVDLRSHELDETTRLANSLRRYQMVIEFTGRTGGILDQAELLEKSTELIQEQFRLNFVGIFLANEASAALELKTATGGAGKALLSDHFKAPYASNLAILKPYNTRKTAYEPQATPESLGPLAATLPQTRSTLDIPLIAGHHISGVLSLHARAVDAFGEDDTRLLEEMAASLALNLELSRSFAELEAELAEAQALHRQYLGETWRQTAQAAGGLDYTYESSAASLEAGPARRLEAPIALRSQVIGRVSLDLERAELTPEERNLVETLASETAVALENTRLLEETQRRAESEQILASVSNKVRASADVDSILRTAILELGRSLKASEGLIRLEPTPGKAGSNGGQDHE